MDYVIFFTYSAKGIQNLKSMALVKAKTPEGALATFKFKINKNEYKDFKIWCIDEISKMYENEDIIIP